MRGLSPAAKGPSETRLASLLRSLSDRVRSLETRANNYGGWRLAEENGELYAVHVPTGTRRVLASLEAKED